MDRVSNRADG